jgi:glycogen synthase
MKIAFISYEYPPDTAFGGIATYIRQAAAMLRDCGHHVEIFAGSRTRQGSAMEDDLLVHRLITRNRLRFAELIAPVFARRHAHAKFDVVEGPDYSADAREVVRWVPNMPLVIKLHTPTAISKGFNRAVLSPLTIAKAVIGDLRWGILPGSDIKEVTEAKHRMPMILRLPVRRLAMLAANFGILTQRGSAWYLCRLRPRVRY